MQISDELWNETDVPTATVYYCMDARRTAHRRKSSLAKPTYVKIAGQASAQADKLTARQPRVLIHQIAKDRTRNNVHLVYYNVNRPSRPREEPSGMEFCGALPVRLRTFLPQMFLPISV